MKECASFPPSKANFFFTLHCMHTSSQGTKSSKYNEGEGEKQPTIKAKM